MRRDTVFLLRLLLEEALLVAVLALRKESLKAAEDELMAEDGRRFEPAVEVQRPDERFERVGQRRIAVATAARFFAAAEEQIFAELQFACHHGQMLALHERRAPVSQLAFGLVAQVIEVFGRDQFEHRVAEELHALVVRRALALAHRTAVRQRLHQQILIAECDSDGLLEHDV